MENKRKTIKLPRGGWLKRAGEKGVPKLINFMICRRLP